MKSTILKIFILIVGFTFASCDKIELLNENPNEPSVVNSSVLMTSGMRTMVNSSVNQSFLLGNNAAQLTAKTVRTEVDVYNWNAFPVVWDEMYTGLRNVIEAEQLAESNGNEKMQGATIVMKSWAFSVLTNAYGDIPYSESITGVMSGNFTPAYDAQSEIYNGANGLLAELERAVTLLNGSGSVSGDIIFNNDATKWVKFANSLRLRLLIQISNKQDVTAEIATLVNSDLLASNNDNAAVTYTGNFPNEFPLLPLKTGDFDAVVLGTIAYDVMTGYNDPRLIRYARPNDGDYTNVALTNFSGATNGSESPVACPKNGSRLGSAYYDYPSQTRASALGVDRAEAVLMTYAEVEFLLAEAALKGYTSGSTEDHYKAGIQASMSYHQVDLATFGYTDFNNYYNTSGVAYDEAIDVWEQKWLALFFHGLEPYFEVRRWLAESNNDFDAIRFLQPTCQNTNNDLLPTRFLYPGEEQSLNNENYQMAIDQLGGTNGFNAKMWLLDF
jgi:hypothetical protein